MTVSSSFEFSSLLMSKFFVEVCGPLVPQDDGLFLLTNAPALGGIDANAFGSEAELLLKYFARHNLCDAFLDVSPASLFSSFVNSTSRGHSTSFAAGEGIPAMSGRSTHVPTMMPNTSWTTSSGFMLLCVSSGPCVLVFLLLCLFLRSRLLLFSRSSAAEVSKIRFF